MKYLCFAVVFLYAVFLHSGAMAGDSPCVTPEQFKEGMDIAEQMKKDGEMDPECEDLMVMEKDQEIAKKKMEDCLAKLKEMEPEEKEKKKGCTKEFTYHSSYEREWLKGNFQQKYFLTELNFGMHKCLRETWEKIVGNMKKDPISKECLQEMMKNCPFQNA